MSVNNAIDYPDLHHLRAAEGWLELGNSSEASAELDQISRAYRVHPDVLVLRWHIYLAARKWHPCLVIARAVTESVPADPRGWLALAETFFCRGQVRQAYKIINAKVNAFPDSWRFQYDLARYACLLGKSDEAEFYLQRAMNVGNAKAIRRWAREDPAFEIIWKPVTD
jgi:predicted Zn-dependent protease